MTSATMTSKGQITIPSKVRAYLHADKGSHLQFTPYSDHAVILEKVQTQQSLLDMAGSLSNHGIHATLDDLDAAIMQEAGNR
jgi:AbrB family looped-hinge helix DNA binding protein